MKGASTNYQDDFLDIDLSYSESMRTLSIMIETSTDAGFDVQVTKIVLPDHVVEHVRYIIDTVSRELKISEERMTEIKQELNKLLGRSQCTKGS